MKKWLLSGLFCLFILLLFQETSFLYTKNALCIWFEKLVPSLFICMVMVRILYDQQFFYLLLKPFQKLIYFLFHMDITSFTLVICSLLLGFPTASILLDEQVARNKISPHDAKRLFHTCSSATPGFIVLSCGSVLYHSIAIGCKLLMIQWVCIFLFLLWTRKTTIIMKDSMNDPSPSFLSSLTKAILESGKTLYMIGGYFMLLMTITATLMDILPSFLALPIAIFTEFSSGVIVIQSQLWSFSRQMISTSMLLGFGGFCVHMQVTGMTPHLTSSYPSYLCWRLFQMIICGGLAYLWF